MSNSRWQRHDYYAKWEEWHISRAVVDGVDKFTVWFCSNRVPTRFNNAKEAVQWIGWVEQNMPAEVSKDKPLTKAQMEMI